MRAGAASTTRFTAPTRWAPCPAGGYDRGRGARVVARARVFLDDAFPIAGASHADIRRYHVEKGQLLADDKPLMSPRNSSAIAAIRAGRTRSCCATTGCMWNWSSTGPIPSARATRRFWPMCGWRRRLRDHGLRGFGRLRRCRGQGAGLWQLAGPDAGRPGRKLREGRRDAVTRILKGDRAYTAPDGSEFTVKGRALMLVRNVGHLMTNPAILLTEGRRSSRG
jgi:malate synthase